MAGGQRHIDIARLADWLAVVEAFHHRQQTRVLLDVAGDGVEVAGALMRAQRRPGFVGGASGGDSGVDIGGGGIGGLRQGLAAGWVGDR